MRAWNIISSSESLKELINNLRDSEGHPYLWYALLYVISNYLIDNPEMMKVLHLTISAISVFLILKYAPFNRVIRTMLVFSYFFFYEYSIISRNYAISIIFMIIFCILYKHKYRNLIPISIVLFMMGLGNLYSFVISIVLFLFLFFDILLERHNYKKSLNKINFSIACAAMVASIFFFYWQLGSQFKGTALSPSALSLIRSVSYKNFLNMMRAIPESIIKSYTSVPDFNLNFWETNIIISFLSNTNVVLIYVLGLILFLIPVFFLKKKVLFLYIAANLSIVIIQAFIWGGFLRHVGHHFIILIVCTWISCLKKEETSLIKKSGNYGKKAMNWFLVVILGISIIGSAIAYYYDYRYPFSTAKKAAEYIENEYNLDELIIIGYSFHTGEVVAGYLNKELYYPYSMNENKFSKSVSWSEIQWGYDVDLPIQAAYGFLLEGDEVLLIISTECEEELLIKNGFSKIEKDFSNSIVPYEYFNLYEFEDDIEQLGLTDDIHYFVINAYSSFLDRAPTQKELVEWVYFLKYEKESAAEFIRSIITDDAFIQRNVDDSLFIEILYEGLLQRKPDKIGFENWTRYLLDNSRAKLLDEFLGSEEYKNICRGYSIVP